MKLREVELKLRVMTTVPLSVLQKASKYDKIIMSGTAVYTGIVLRAGAEVVEPWDEKEATYANRA